MIESKRRLCALGLIAGAVVASPRGGRAQEDDIVKRSREMYAALASYADSGAVVVEAQSPGGPLLTERHRFVTYYQGPRKFFHDFREDPAAGGDRLVIWCDGGDFNTWWATTGVHEVYEKGRGANAFALSALPTNGSALQVPPLLFAGAGLHGPLSDFANYRAVGTERIAGRDAVKLVGEVRLTYQSGHGTARPTTVWIDRETLFVLKVVEETPSGSARGVVSRSTTTLAPLANPRLDEARFRFTPPER